ncbi:NAD(P)-dependent dehydrogenase, short-chain alcohol dehydrogenase family [Filimonas lacunae]|uniref:NAD(P)-dependent dehydrogenase, short-chain alcohol dehydrogenase family n=1 Tax=Filimonas lacunae TaxID=477680 RepID=A0A173MQ86_9BACT|nr:SDR family oxidoreductase [Filimonas lacunae]BAV09541.1 3-oxoacyl-[acyl-carrier protein] reductase [Filimonas lacunae]SIS74928.1 NAD(P)-dependent dehydrogenase, short-chain alcohol dehydrogenase family [Filimonas lacunae]
MERTTHKELAIVTGGASGIGLAIAQRFVEAGIFTIVVGRDQQKLQNAKTTLGDLCATISADLSELSSIPALIEQIEKDFGAIDILVNNAGINMKKEFQDVTDEDFQKIILTNLQSVFSVSREVVKHMLPRGKGSIINISSMAARYGIPKVIAYTASKSAIEGMTQAMAVELSPKGIRVNCIAPGFIGTDMSAKALDSDPERKHKAMSRTPMGKLGIPMDVGNAALFLAGSEAAYITGVSLAVDGGNSIGF